MLTFDQMKSLESALGADKAGPVIQVLETVEERLRSGMSQELATKQDVDEVRQALKQDVDELRKEFVVTRAELMTEIEKTKSESIKWMAGMLVAQAALVAALVKLIS